MRNHRHIRTISILLASLLGGVLLTASPVSAASKKLCNPETESQWATLRVYGTVVNFEKNGAKPVDAKAYAQQVKTIVDETVTSVAYGTEILLLVGASADSGTGTPQGNQRTAEARAKSVYSTLRRALNPTDVGRIYGSTVGTVTSDPGEAGRKAWVTVLKCTVAPETPKPAYDRSKSGKEFTCDPAKTKVSYLLTETWQFQPAKPSYKDGLKPADETVYTTGIANVSAKMLQAIDGSGGVHVQVTGSSTATGRSRSNDSLATGRAKTVANALIAAAKSDARYDADKVGLRVIGTRLRTDQPQVKVTLSYCP
jgi:hypothetical protein